MIRRIAPYNVAVSSTATSLVISPGFDVNELVVTSLTVLQPVYFRVDGVTATIGGQGQPIVNGYGGSTTIDVEGTSITLSLITSGSGTVHVTAIEAG